MSEAYHSHEPEETLSDEIPTVRELPVLDELAFYGLAGKFVNALAPHTEADPAALLVQTLVTFGAACGRNPHLMIDGARHGTNEFCVIVGQSGKGRKGTSWQRTRETFRHADEEFSGRCIKGGLSSGEGLIYQIRDPSFRFDEKTQTLVMFDQGIDDKRLLIVESEFASVLKMIEREGNSLSPILRQAWDGDKLSPLTKTSRIEATDPHVGMIGQITETELLSRLTETESANGFGNRILWIYARRSKFLPFGGQFIEAPQFGTRFKEALDVARLVGKMGMAAGFRAKWEEVYRVLSEGGKGLAGTLTNRAEAHAMRLSMIYALLDGKAEMSVPHLTPALAIVDYVSDSAEYIFGSSSGDPLAELILGIVEKKGGSASMMDVYAATKGHKTKGQIEKAISDLVSTGKLTVETIETGGRPRQILKTPGAK